MKLYGITDKILAWFESYLSNRRQYIQIGENRKTYVKYVTCGVLQGSILGPLLVLVSVNDLPSASSLSDPIMFDDDTTLFFNHTDIKSLLTAVNNELVNIKNWFTANKLSLNVEKTKYSFFHKPSKKEDIPLRLPKRIINNQVPWSFLDKRLTWKEHIQLTENKINKIIGILYKARPYLDKRTLLCLYYSYIQSCLIYANTACCSTNRPCMKKIHKNEQKHAIRIFFHKKICTYTRTFQIK